MPTIFLSSVLFSLQKERKYIYEWFKNKGYNVFAFEEDDATRKKFKISLSVHDRIETDTYNEKVCLDGVIESDVYIGIFKTRYGGSADNHQINIALTELELYTAIKFNKPIIIYIANYGDDCDSDPVRNIKFRNLLNIIKCFDGLQERIRYCNSEIELLESIKYDFANKVLQHRPTFSFDKFANTLIQTRIGLLNDYTYRLPKIIDNSVNFKIDQFPTLIQNINNNLNFYEKFDLSGNLILTLNSIDNFDDLKYPDHWNKLLKYYKDSAGWIGLHGPLDLGRLAADNSIIELKLRIATNQEIKSVEKAINSDIYTKKPGTTKEWAEFYRSYESLSSEFYSISKLCALKSQKIKNLDKAEIYINIAEHSYSIDNSMDEGEYGFYSQKANILFAKGILLNDPTLVDNAIGLFYICAEKRKEKFGDYSAEYGEALAGYGYAKIQRDQKAGFVAMFEGMEILETYNERLQYLQRIQGKYAYQLLLKGNIFQKVQAPWFLYKAYKTRKKLGLSFSSLFESIKLELMYKR